MICSHETVAHVLQLFRDLPGRALELVSDLFLLGRVQNVEALATGKTVSEGRKREGNGK